MILHIDKGLYYELDGAGGRVWELIQSQPRLGRDLVETIAGEYDVARDRCESDIFALLDDLEQRGLIEIAD